MDEQTPMPDCRDALLSTPEVTPEAAAFAARMTERARAALRLHDILSGGPVESPLADWPKGGAL